MAEAEQLATDGIAALKPAIADTGTTAEAPRNDHTIEPLDLSENPRIHTKLRIYAILLALYVGQLSRRLKSLHWLTTLVLACLLRRSSRSDYRRNIHSHNMCFFTLCFRLHLDWQRLLAGKRRSRSSLG